MKRLLLAVAFLGLSIFAVKAERIENVVAATSVTRVGGPDILVDEGWAFLTCDAPIQTITVTDFKGTVLLKVHPEASQYELYLGKSGLFILTIKTAKVTYVVPVTVL